MRTVCSATHSSHCSIHSAVSVTFSATEVWNFSLPSPMVTKGSLLPFFPLIFSPLARFTEHELYSLGLAIFSVLPRTCAWVGLHISAEND